MKKSKIAITLMTALLSVGTMTACSDVKYDENGVILTYTGEDGEKHQYTAEDLLIEQLEDSSSYETVFNTVYKMVIKNYFTIQDPDQPEYGAGQLAGLKEKARNAVEGDKQTAKNNQDKNNSSYDKEFDEILKSKNCKDEDELFESYLYQYEEETFNKNFENVDVNLRTLKKGTGFGASNHFEGYFNAKVPYHISHILVKIEDSDSTNYATATVSQANAKKLYTVADALAKGTYASFADAAFLSDDSAERGDLGLVDMTKAGNYINEFKYAVYAYENFWGKTAEAQASKVKIADPVAYKGNGADVEGVNHLVEDAATQEEAYDHSTSGADPVAAKAYTTLSPEGFSVIPFGAFEILNSNYDRETGADGVKVHDGNANFYPRNIFFNHYFNRHAFALVSPNAAIVSENSPTEYLDTIGSASATGINILADGATGTGFHNFTAADGVNFTGTYLATSIKLGNKVVYRPILVVRGGSGSGEGGYQGIHFIVVNRSPFEYINGDEDTSVASLENYYTTYFPSQSRYPTYGEGTKLQTYVNFSGNSANYQTRAEEVLNTLKEFNKDGLKYFMFKKYLEAGKLAIADIQLKNGSTLKDALYKWMDRSQEYDAYDLTNEWENSWATYMDSLTKSTSIQKQAISKGCAIYYNDHARGGADKTDPKQQAAWDEVGGICNDGNKHN